MRRHQRFECPVCGLNQTFNRNGVHFCPNDGSMMIRSRYHNFSTPAMKTTQLSAREELNEILFDRGDRSKRLLEGTMWREGPGKEIFGAVTATPSGKTDNAAIRRINADLKAGAITPEVAAKGIEEQRKAQIGLIKKGRTNAMIKADATTNISGFHGGFHTTLKNIHEQGETRAKPFEESGTKSDLAQAKAIRKETAEHAAKQAGIYKSSIISSDPKKREVFEGIEKKTGNVILINAKEAAGQGSAHGSARQQARHAKVLRTASNSQIGLPFLQQQAGEDFERYRGAIAKDAAEERSLRTTIRTALKGGPTAPKTLSPKELAKRAKKKMPDSHWAGLKAEGTERMAASAELAPKVRAKLTERAESNVNRRLKKMETYLRHRSQRFVRNPAKGVTPFKGNETAIIKEAQTYTTPILNPKSAAKRYLTDDAAFRMGMSDKRYGAIAKQYERLKSGEAQVSRQRAWSRNPSVVKSIIKGIEPPSNTGAIKALPGALKGEWRNLRSAGLGKAARAAGTEVKRAVQRIGRNHSGKIGIAAAAGATGLGLLGYGLRKKKPEEKKLKQLSSRMSVIEFAGKRNTSYNGPFSEWPVEQTPYGLQQEAITDFEADRRRVDPEPKFHPRDPNQHKRTKKDISDGIKAEKAEAAAKAEAEWTKKAKARTKKKVTKAKEVGQISSKRTSPLRVEMLTHKHAAQEAQAEVERQKQRLAKAQLGVGRISNERRSLARNNTALELLVAQQKAEGLAAKAEHAGQLAKAQQSYIDKARATGVVRRASLKKARKFGRRLGAVGLGAGLVAGGVGGWFAGRNRKSKETQFAAKDKKKHMNPYVMAGLSGATSGAVLGALPALRRGATLRGVLKTMAGSALASGAIVGGGAKLGSSIVGEPRPDEGSAFTRRAALGGTIVGGGLGLIGGLAAKSRGTRSLLAKAARSVRGKGMGRRIARSPHTAIRSIQIGVKKAAKEYVPAETIRKNGIIAAGGLGAGIGAAYGLYQGADEGQQVDSILNIKKDLKNMSAIDQLIMFEEKAIKRAAVAADRYRKKIEIQEDDRRQANLLKAGIVGAAGGTMFRKSLMRKLPLTNAGVILAGIGTGVATQGAISQIGKRQKDEFGDVPLEIKKRERLPYRAGALGLLGAGLYKSYKTAKGLKRFSRRGKLIQLGTDDVVDWLGRSVLNQASEDARRKELKKDWNRAQRKSNSIRRKVDRTRNLITDAKLKLKGEKKLDERGRERKNEWDKSWVKKAAIGAGVTGVALLTHRAHRNIAQRAEVIRSLNGTGVKGLADPQARLYNAVRGRLLRAQPMAKTYGSHKAKFNDLMKSPIVKAMHDNRDVSRPILRARMAFRKAGGEVKEIADAKTVRVAEKLEGVTADEVKKKALTGEPLSLVKDPLEELRRIKHGSVEKFSRRGRIINFATEVEYVPVENHVRSRRKTKEELNKKRLSEEREDAKRNRTLAGFLGLGTGGTAVAGYDYISPKRRATRAAARMTTEQVDSKVAERVAHMMGQTPAQKAAIAAEEAAKKSDLSRRTLLVMRRMRGI